MENKYIENLGMCNEINEGLWDRLKSRVAGYAQAGKNVLGGGTTEMQAAQFSSLFKKFLNNCISTIKDFDKVMVPYVNAGKATPEEKQQIDEIVSLYWAVQDIGPVPITEANLFTRPFSALGAQASGKVQNIIDAYKKLLRTHYETFMNDAKKLNIVPAEYITRKVAATFPAAKDFLSRFESAVGVKPPVPTTAPTTPLSKPADALVVAPAEPKKTSAAPVATTPPEAAAPTTPDFFKKSAAKIGVSEPPRLTPSGPPEAPTTPTGEASEDDKNTWDIVQLSFDKLISDLLPTDKSTTIKEADAEAGADVADDETEDAGLSMPTLIQKYSKRDAYKARYPFKGPHPEVAQSDGTVKVWHLRYARNKEIHGSDIQYAENIEKPKGPGSKERTPIKWDSSWKPFLSFNADDVINDDGSPNYDFKVMENIRNTNPELGAKLDRAFDAGKGSLLKNEGFHRKVIDALRVVEMASAREAGRGFRIDKPPVPTEPIPGTEKGGGVPLEPPIGGPKAVEPATGSVPPELKARTSLTGTPPRPPVGGELTFDKKEREKAEKDKKKAAAKKVVSKTPTVKKKPVTKIKTEGTIKLRDFFPL